MYNELLNMIDECPLLVPPFSLLYFCISDLLSLCLELVRNCLLNLFPLRVRLEFACESLVDHDLVLFCEVGCGC